MKKGLVDNVTSYNEYMNIIFAKLDEEVNEIVATINDNSLNQADKRQFKEFVITKLKEKI